MRFKIIVFISTAQTVTAPLGIVIAAIRKTLHSFDKGQITYVKSKVFINFQCSVKPKTVVLYCAHFINTIPDIPEQGYQFHVDNLFRYFCGSPVFLFGQAARSGIQQLFPEIVILFISAAFYKIIVIFLKGIVKTCQKTRFYVVISINKTEVTAFCSFYTLIPGLCRAAVFRVVNQSNTPVTVRKLFTDCKAAVRRSIIYQDQFKIRKCLMQYASQ